MNYVKTAFLLELLFLFSRLHILQQIADASRFQQSLNVLSCTPVVSRHKDFIAKKLFCMFRTTLSRLYVFFYPSILCHLDNVVI